MPDSKPYDGSCRRCYDISVARPHGGHLTFRVRAATMNDALRQAFRDPDVPEDAISVLVELGPEHQVGAAGSL